MEAKALLFGLLLVFCVIQLHEAAKKNKLIVFLVDGVRWDYIDDPGLKGIPRIIKEGVRAPFVYPIYPSVSYPNWYTIVTGLYAENHGFVSNDIYDPKTKAIFHANSTDLTSLGPSWWDEAEPIWISTEKNNGTTAAMYWWAGCEIEIKKKHPMICERHRYGPGTDEEDEDFVNRINDLLTLFKPGRSLDDGSRGLALALMYHGSLDYNGHMYGPESKEVKKSLYRIDKILDTLQNRLDETGLSNEVNIMVVSDHGMISLPEKNTTLVDLDKFTPSIKLQVTSGTSSMILPEDNMLEKLYNDLVQEKIPGINVYKKEDIPKNYYLKDNDKVTPIFLQAKQGYYIKPIKDNTKRVGTPYAPQKGTHGYDPYVVEEMRTIFIARGPDFPKQHKLPELHNVDFYNVMCRIIGIEPLPNNGSWDRVKSIFESDNRPLPITTSGASASCHQLFLISCLFVIASFFY